jgi:hypothetical protein
MRTCRTVSQGKPVFELGVMLNRDPQPLDDMLGVARKILRYAHLLDLNYSV